VTELENRIKEYDNNNKRLQNEVDSIKSVTKNQNDLLQSTELTEDQKQNVRQ
jgi:hypothetical protein